MSKRKDQSQTISLVATIFVAVAAIALAVVAIITVNQRNQPQQPQESNSVVVDETFKPTQEFVEECTYAAHDLVQESYRIIRLFVLEGLAHYDEPYGNEPEDGIYTVNSTEYTSLAQIEELVNSVYTKSEAQRILHNIDGSGMSVYLDREILVEVEESSEGTSEATAESATEESGVRYTTEKVLGINADFKPDTDYDKDWSSCVIAVLPKSENECELTVYLDGLNAETATAADAESVLEIAMIKTDGEWQLANFVY